MGRNRPSMSVRETLLNGTEFSVAVDAPKSPYERRMSHSSYSSVDPDAVLPIVCDLRVSGPYASGNYKPAEFNAEELRHLAKTLQRAAHHIEMLEQMRCAKCGEYETSRCYCDPEESA